MPSSAREAQGGLERIGDDELIATRAYELFLGDLAAVPRFGKTAPSLDSRSAFLLSRIDGTTNADDLLDVSGMPRLEAVRVLAKLVADGIVVLKK
jgi:CRP-like cAMP-binding protein